MVCIGANNDGIGTLTFQTEGLFPETLAYGNNTPLNDYSISSIKTYCDQFASICTAKDSIKTIIKYHTVYGESTPRTIQVRGWLPSPCEMGVTSNCSLKDWTVGGIEQPYSYYDSNEKRQKSILPNGDKNHYWLRSYYRAGIDGGITTPGIIFPQGSFGGDYSITSACFAPAFTIG